MINNNKYTIQSSSTILQALTALNEIGHALQTLFVVDENDKMVGTLTDGDIRRSLIAGNPVDAPVSSVMHTEFQFIKETEWDVRKLKSLRKLNILFIPILDGQQHIVGVCNLMKYKNLLPMDAVLMAGGKGERLRPLTERTPKPLLPVGDKAIIDYNIDNLAYYGVKNISVTVNYLKEQLEEHFAEERNGIQVRCVREPRFLGTIGSLRFVEKFENETILVMNSDLFTNIDLEDFYLQFVETGADMSAAAIPYSVSVPYGIFNVNEDNITGLVTAYNASNATGNWKTFSDKIYDLVYSRYEPLMMDGSGNPRNGTHVIPVAEPKKKTSNFQLEDYMFTYDSRLDPYDNAAKLNTYINKVLSVTGKNKVNLIGRCLGTTIISTYLTQYGCSKVETAIFYASAFNGVYMMDGFFTGDIDIDYQTLQYYLQYGENDEGGEFETIRSIGNLFIKVC